MKKRPLHSGIASFRPARFAAGLGVAVVFSLLFANGSSKKAEAITAIPEDTVLARPVDCKGLSSADCTGTERVNVPYTPPPATHVISFQDETPVGAPRGEITAASTEAPRVPAR